METAVVAPILTSFATLCLLFPSPTAQVLGSGYAGYGLGNLSFDWSVVGSMGGLYMPWFGACLSLHATSSCSRDLTSLSFGHCPASLNRFVGFAGMVWLIAPLLYFGNWWNSLSFSSPVGPGLYSSNYEKFSIVSVIDPQTMTLDLQKWEELKPLLLTP